MQDFKILLVSTHIVVSSQHCICSVQDNLFALKSSGIGKCTEICYKDPVLEDRQWSAYIDRSPGQDSYSLVRTSLYRLTGLIWLLQHVEVIKSNIYLPCILVIVALVLHF